MLVLSVRASDIQLPQLAEAVLARTHNLTALSWLRFGHLEAGANILVFIPVGFLLAALLGRRGGPRVGVPFWAVWLLATLVSAGIELIQGIVLTQRSATVRDVVCNSAGAMIGVGAFRVLQVLGNRPHTRAPDPGRRER